MAERTQQQYQVRFAWGLAGAARIAADTHLLVWADALPSRGTSDPHARDPHVGDPHVGDPHADDLLGDGRALRRTAALLPDGPEVVLGHLGNASAIAERVTRLQAERGDRCVVAIVAAGGDHDARSDAADAAGEASDTPEAPDFAVEDLLAAGAVVDALAEVGIDHTSPEAAAACAAYTGLRRAVKHLVSASEAARTLDPAVVHAAIGRSGGIVTLRA